MPKYTLYFGPHTFELADAKAAVVLLKAVETVPSRGAVRLRVPTTTGSVTLIISPSTQIAIAMEGADADADELG